MESIYSYAAALKRNDASCTVVNLNCSMIGNDGLRRLATALQHNTHLVVLFLNRNGFNTFSSTWQLFCQAIAQHPRLQYVYLSSNQLLGPSGLTTLFHEMAQAQNAQIKVLKVSDCCCTCQREQVVPKSREVARALSSWLIQPCCSLQTLAMDQNSPGLDLRSFLQEMTRRNSALTHNTSLQTLDIQGNQLLPSPPRQQQQQQKEGGESSCVWKDLAQILQHHNTTVSVVKRSNLFRRPHQPCECCSDKQNCHEELLQCYLTLNGWGRQSFNAPNLTSAAWTHLMGKAATVAKTKATNGETNGNPVSKPPSLLYHVIRARPDLLTCGASALLSSTRAAIMQDAETKISNLSSLMDGRSSCKKRRVLLGDSRR
mmetsp:Transcript_11138/g.24829  ORF Transcript_11138/g.24829 Transcript_11138/m.24829 type:complete len:372 (+) Transcript_11138:312-1427(+)|eukprot:CAMPEP_0168732562 /NCGR_PEP_ID=MMETSP0724-20121128/7834_1 /TAXON_ID=265536 /ORGANISM="Amphiprora sp., Strain CCMP467" /LENGTH=371 /DNA_ID=CAMNT_0008779583 /DNA_START=242 /DNA_END=1357 /DNA_ORIENTATION=+